MIQLNNRRYAKAIAPSKSVGTTSKKMSDKKTQEAEGFTALSSGGSLPTGLPNTNLSVLPITVDMNPLLDGFGHFHKGGDVLFYPLYRDMYYFDAIAGSATDMISSLPFSDFTIAGINDKKVLSAFRESVDRLNIRTMLPEISIDYLVLGTFLASLLYDKGNKVFTDIMPHAVENAEITKLPFYNQDPIIEVAFPDHIKKVFTKESKRIASLKKKYGDTVISKLLTNKLELDPLSTIYLPRRTFSSLEGTSYFKRLIPIYLLEKNLFRGTLIESSRRQRGILHLTVGDGDQWEPTPDDLDFVTDLFLNADADPLGAIIATRLGVSVEEIRQGGEFWKINDVWDSTTTMKMRALGISEGLLSGDASWNTMETSLTVFIDYLRAYRDMITRKVFYNKIFPLISLVNGFSVNTNGKIILKDNLMQDNIEDNLDLLQDGSKLLIPTVHWAKQLKPEGDSNYFDILDKLTQAGVPIPLRVVAAAGGFNLDELFTQQEDDLTLRERVGEYFQKLQEVKAKFAPPEAAGDDGSSGGGGDDFSGEASSLLSVLASEDPSGNYRSAVQAKARKKPSILARDYGEASEVVERTRTGKPKHVFRQAVANSKANDAILKAVKESIKNKPSQLNRTTLTSKK